MDWLTDQPNCRQLTMTVQSNMFDPQIILQLSDTFSNKPLSLSLPPSISLSLSLSGAVALSLCALHAHSQSHLPSKPLWLSRLRFDFCPGHARTHHVWTWEREQEERHKGKKIEGLKERKAQEVMTAVERTIEITQGRWGCTKSRRHNKQMGRKNRSRN